MPSTATITAFYTFAPLTIIKSAEMNTNLSNFRGHNIPINTDTATASNQTHDLGSSDYMWRGVYEQYGVLYQNATSTSIPTPAAGSMALFYKSDGLLYKKNPAGTVTLVEVDTSSFAPKASPTFTGTITTPLTASRALASGASSELAVSATTATELGYLSGVTSAIQTQINTKKATFSPSQILRSNPNSMGGSSSGDTRIINYGTAISSTGTDITFTARTTTTADKYTINTTGLYFISAMVRDTGAGNVWGITLNTADTSNAPQTIPAEAIFGITNGITNQQVQWLGGVYNLTANDVIRVQNESSFTLGSFSHARFTIVRVG